MSEECLPCNANAVNPQSLEYGRGYKIENNSQLGTGTGIDVARGQPSEITTKVIRSEKTREDFN